MELSGLPLNQEDYFIDEREVTFVGYEMFGGEKFSFNETPYLEYSGNETQPGEMHCVHLNTALIVRPKGPAPKRPRTE